MFILCVLNCIFQLVFPYLPIIFEYKLHSKAYIIQNTIKNMRAYLFNFVVSNIKLRLLLTNDDFNKYKWLMCL